MYSNFYIHTFYYIKLFIQGNEDNHEGNHISRWFGESFISTNDGNIKTIIARIRQADDLLSAVNFNAGKNSGYFDYFYAYGFAKF